MGVAGRQEDNSLKRYLRGASMRLQGMKEASGSQALVFQILNARALRILNARNEIVVRAVTTRTNNMCGGRKFCLLTH
ncbi:hypothetical protein ALC56_09173 [Trachymyrmex septentrionalis]|uniref:Uncharacterized protein n=1 Tax=Trachymyrmex septentrionalis TaxID=34720 RepID=A0A195F6Y0_9HYME|nr:hypothetical protein ALC56_09173 [Trachymyrmex septentrionalis]